MLTQHYAQILHLHIASVALSGSLFLIRGSMRLFDAPLANHRLLRILSVVIDTVLLGAAILLTLILRQYPLVDAWLTVKLVLLVVYVVLGTLALKRARSFAGRASAFAAALIVFAFIISVALRHDPLGAIGWILKS